MRGAGDCVLESVSFKDEAGPYEYKLGSGMEQFALPSTRQVPKCDYNLKSTRFELTDKGL